MSLIAFTVDYLDGNSATEYVSAFETLQIRKEFGDNWIENPEARYKITHKALTRTGQITDDFDTWLSKIGPVTDITDGTEGESGKDSTTTTEPSQPS